MRKRIYLTTGALLVIFFLFGILYQVGAVFSNWGFHDRKRADVHRSVVRWKEGDTGFADYSTFPGSYNWKLQWEGDNGEKVVMLELGDDPSPSCEVGEDGHLHVTYKRGLVVSIFDTPSNAPLKTLGSELDDSSK